MVLFGDLCKLDTNETENEFYLREDENGHDMTILDCWYSDEYVYFCSLFQIMINQKKLKGFPFSFYVLIIEIYTPK